MLGCHAVYSVVTINGGDVYDYCSIALKRCGDFVVCAVFIINGDGDDSYYFTLICLNYPVLFFFY